MDAVPKAGGDWRAAAAKARERARWQIALLPGCRRLRRAMAGPGTWDARRPEPLSRAFGWDRGEPIDRRYIAAFLSAHAADITGHVLEVGDDRYTRRFGCDVRQTDVVDVNAANRRATIISDLATGDGLPSATFDCVVLVQTLLLVFDLRSAVAQVHRSLADGGVVLATLPGISQLCTNVGAEWHDYWRFTEASARHLFAERFGEDRVTVEVRGSLTSACAFLQGRAAEELTQDQLDLRDRDYPLLIGVRAVKRG